MKHGAIGRALHLEHLEMGLKMGRLLHFELLYKHLELGRPLHFLAALDGETLLTSVKNGLGMIRF